MEIGDYVKTKDGRIGKIIQEEYITPCNDKHRYIYLTDADNEMWYDEDTIIKPSPNITDLIEVGDYVNGEKVIRIFNPTFLSIGELPYVITDKNKYEPQEIKSIVTKEQFESMEYRIGDENE